MPGTGNYPFSYKSIQKSTLHHCIQLDYPVWELSCRKTGYIYSKKEIEIKTDIQTNRERERENEAGQNFDQSDR